MVANLASASVGEFLQLLFRVAGPGDCFKFGLFTCCTGPRPQFWGSLFAHEKAATLAQIILWAMSVNGSILSCSVVIWSGIILRSQFKDDTLKIIRHFRCDLLSKFRAVAAVAANYDTEKSFRLYLVFLPEYFSVFGIIP